MASFGALHDCKELKYMYPSLSTLLPGVYPMDALCMNSIECHKDIHGSIFFFCKNKRWEIICMSISMASIQWNVSQ